MSKQQNRRACSECPSSFELVPPADPEYSEPKERPKSDDHIKRIYECEGERHRNTIYWHKKEFLFAASEPSTEGELQDYRSISSGRGRARGEFDRL